MDYPLILKIVIIVLDMVIVLFNVLTFRHLYSSSAPKKIHNKSQQTYGAGDQKMIDRKLNYIYKPNNAKGVAHSRNMQNPSIHKLTEDCSKLNSNGKEGVTCFCDFCKRHLVNKIGSD